MAAEVTSLMTCKREAVPLCRAVTTHPRTAPDYGTVRAAMFAEPPSTSHVNV